MSSEPVSDDVQERADRRLEEALERSGAADPRGPCRALLRELKASSEDDYADFVARWRQEVLEPIARDEADPLLRWLAFSLALARAAYPGRTVVVDETGRARSLEGAPSREQLVLHLPDQQRVRALALAVPPTCSRAQRATLELLVEGRLGLPAELAAAEPWNGRTSPA